MAGHPLHGGPHREERSSTPVMHGPEQSDTNIVPKKPANKAPRRVAERVEGRAVDRGKHAPTSHVPDAEPGARVPDGDACTASQPLGHPRWLHARLPSHPR